MPNLCPRCGEPMLALFLSEVCNTCDAGGSFGWIVDRGRPPGSAEYIFFDNESAKLWRATAGLDRFPIAKVWCCKPPRWRYSTGDVPGIRLADRLYYVYPTRESARSVDLSEGSPLAFREAP